MAYANDIQSGLSGASFLSNLRAAIVDGYAKRRLYKRTINELSSLSSRDLADLGISRSMIKSIAIETAYGAK